MKKMEMRRIGYIALLVLGIIVVIAGVFITEQRWGGVLIGVGAGVLGMSGAQLITQQVMIKNPGLSKQVATEQSDERNIQINNYAKGKAFDFLQVLALPFFLVLILADVQLWIVLLAIVLYVADWVVYLWYMNRRMKEI
ncbi:MAG: hypothetical protein GX979_02770 [Firmicutes bacterium]|mgnify:CR=1 FL=1|nr:hypothetical protein [Bacillota bacterium]